MNIDDLNFKVNFENKVKETIEKYKLIDKGERVLVACSGGKDSISVLYLLNKFGYNPEALIIDLEIGDYSKKNLENVKFFCNEHNIKLYIVSFKDIYNYSLCYICSVLKSKYNLNPCYVCGILKRHILNKKALELKFDKLATGHNMDDEAQNIFMNYIQGNLLLSAKLGPITGITKDEKFVPRIKPLYFCSDEDVRKYSQIMKFPVLYEKCPCSVGVFRREIKEIFKHIEKEIPNFKENLIRNLMKISPILKEEYLKKTKEMRYCEICHQPSENKICKSCELMEKLKDIC